MLQFPSCIHYWRVVKPYRAKGADGWEVSVQASVLAGRQGSPQEDGQMAPSLPAALSETCLLDWSRFFTQPSCISQQAVLHIPASSCPRDGGQFLCSVGAQHQLLLCCITCTALLGESSSEAHSLCSSPPLTTVSPLTHDWQQQAGGGRPAGHKPALRLAWIHWKKTAEGLAEKSLTGGTALFPRQSDVQTSGLIRSFPCMLLHHSFAPSTPGKRQYPFLMQLFPFNGMSGAISTFGAKGEHYLAITES